MARRRLSFGPSSTFAQTIKHYRKGSRRGPDHRYEPPRDPFIVKRAVFGAPDMAKASTAYSERLNLTMRHVNGRLRRFCCSACSRSPFFQASWAASGLKSISIRPRVTVDGATSAG